MRAVTKAKPRAQLLLPLRNRAAFLDRHFGKGKAGGLFIPGALEVELGEPVDVELHFVEEQVRFHIRAVVKWKRQNAGRRSIPPGVGIEFLAMDRPTEELIVRFAEGRESVHHVDRARRFAVQIEVAVRGPHGMTLDGTTEDISEGGCFVLTDVNLEVGTKVEVRLKVSDRFFGRLTLPAQVAWRREQKDRSGMGLAFVFENDRQRTRIKKALEKLKERLVRDLKIKTPRLS